MAAKTSTSQRRTIGRVMHEAKHGELKSGPGGKGGKVKSRKQAIAIAMHEAGASRKESPTQRKRSATQTRAKEATGRTGQQEREGKSRVGARGRKESSPAMRGRAASGSRSTGATSRSTGAKAKTGTGSRAKTKTGARTSKRSAAAAKAGRASGRARKTK